MIFQALTLSANFKFRCGGIKILVWEPVTAYKILSAALKGPGTRPSLQHSSITLDALGSGTTKGPLKRATAEPQRGLNHTKTQPRVSKWLQSGFAVQKPKSHCSCDERIAKWKSGWRKQEPRTQIIFRTAAIFTQLLQCVTLSIPVLIAP